MAKLANVGYGHDGRGLGKSDNGYTYVVNDNVRTGDVLQVSVVHYKSGQIFGTTGLALETMKETSKKGQEQKQKLQNVTKVDENGEEYQTKVTPTRAYTGKEAGSQGTDYKMQTRGFNILARQGETNGELAPTENVRNAIDAYYDNHSNYISYDEYSKNFIGDKK